MKKADTSAEFGASLPRLLWRDLRDRLSGNRARANARWGWVTAPTGRGKVIVVHGGREFESVQLAADLLAAIRHKRQDVRLVLLFEQDHSEAYNERFRGLKKVAVGYSSCDRPAAIRRMLNRLQPLGVIFVGQQIRPGWAKVSVENAERHVVAFQSCSEQESHRFEVCCPAMEQSCENQHCDYSAEPSDAQTILAQSQVEPSFAGIVRGAGEFPLWLIHGDVESHIDELLKAWRETNFCKDSLLCVTAYDNPAIVLDTCAKVGLSGLRISQWQRQALSPGSILVIDQQQWLPALAASVNAAHMMGCGKVDAWQLMAGGKALSRDAATCLIDDAPVPMLHTLDGVFQYWQELLDEPYRARQAGDANRQYFWQQRRKAQSVVDELLLRVYDW